MISSKKPKKNSVKNSEDTPISLYISTYKILHIATAKYVRYEDGWDIEFNNSNIEIFNFLTKKIDYDTFAHSLFFGQGFSFADQSPSDGGWSNCPVFISKEAAELCLKHCVIKKDCLILHNSEFSIEEIKIKII